MAGPTKPSGDRSLEISTPREPANCGGCCGTKPVDIATASTYDRVTDVAMEGLRIIVLLGLSGYVAYSNPEIFGYFCAGGFVVGLYLQYRVEKKKIYEATHYQAGCGQSLMSQLTGVRLPPIFQLATDVAIFYDHIRYPSHRQILGPITAFNFGTFLGKIVMQAIFACKQPAETKYERLQPEPNKPAVSIEEGLAASRDVIYA